MTDKDLLRLVSDERARSIGFDHDETLSGDRETALDYFNGVMDDLDAAEGTSTATSSDIADAVETVLPDLVEVFTTEEVAAFVPTSEADVAQAEQETDFVNHVVLSDNPGTVLFNDMFRDALQLKVGVVMAQWEDAAEAEPETFSGTTQDALAAVVGAKASGAVIGDFAQGEGGEITWTVTPPQGEGRVCITGIAPEDFTVSADTVRLADSPYCAFKARVRRQQLIADGYDAGAVDELSAYGLDDDPLSQARSTAGEDDPTHDGADKESDLVKIVTHFIRRLENSRLVIWKVVTGNDEGVLLAKEKANSIPFAAVTPYRVTHRFYGQSLADKLMEIQRIKTALLRMTLNAGYFAQNQRLEIGEGALNAHTLKDIMDNRPGQPIRVKALGQLQPVPNGGLGFDTFGAMEFVSAMGEQRSGVVRNAQGLNPDTLHETARGMQALHAAALKRVRYMARLFAETGVKDLFLLVHDLLRTHTRRARLVRMRGKFVEADASKWAARESMSIEIGVGAGGREHDLAVLGQIIMQQEKAVQTGALQAGLLTPKHLYATLSKFASRAGFKSPELFWNDPSAAPAQPQEPKPDPEMAKVQAQAQADAARLQHEREKAQADAQLRMLDSQSKERIAVTDMQIKAQIALQDMQLKHGAKADQIAQELDLKAQIAALQAQLDAERIAMADQHHLESLQVDAAQHAHSEEMKLAGLRHTAALKAQAVTGGDIHVGGEPG